jgi:hypothetical protein
MVGESIHEVAKSQEDGGHGNWRDWIPRQQQSEDDQSGKGQCNCKVDHEDKTGPAILAG